MVFSGIYKRYIIFLSNMGLIGYHAIVEIFKSKWYDETSDPNQLHKLYGC